MGGRRGGHLDQGKGKGLTGGVCVDYEEGKEISGILLGNRRDG